jgi:DNA-binding transcriptional MerR regulator
MSKSMPSASVTGSHNEYTVDELARVTDTTVRNVRAYQDRGLLEPPEKRGRIGIYNEIHAARLKLINHLLARGYTLANIQDLIKAIDEGHDLRSILGLQSAIGSPWSNERPRTYSLPELISMFGVQVSASLGMATELGLLERHGLSFTAKSPVMLEAARALVQEGIPLRDLLDLVAQIRPHFNAIARQLLGLVTARFDRYGAENLPPATEIPALTEMIWRLRPLTHTFVQAEVNRAFESVSGSYLGGRVANILDRAIVEHPSQPEEPQGDRSRTPARK